jgi:AcrR family transcriptional regulator
MSTTPRASSVTAIAVTDEPPTRQATNGSHHKPVMDIQRARMLTAMIQAACEQGGGNVTIAQVVACAGVSRRTFYELFNDREDCFLAALDEALARTARRVIPAYEVNVRWREKMRASLTALLELFDEKPHLGRFVVVESLAAGARALQCRQRMLTTVMRAVQEGGLKARGRAPGPLVAEATVGAVLSVIHTRLLQPEPGPLVELVNPLMSTIVLPYLGASAAQRELKQPVTPTVRRPSAAQENPLRQLEIRLTYRTMRALLAVAERPRSSNRAIADAAGITDQGQISKLLARLARLGLVDNPGGGAQRGEPNAWMLTQAGQDVHNAIVTQA